MPIQQIDLSSPLRLAKPVSSAFEDAKDNLTLGALQRNQEESAVNIERMKQELADAREKSHKAIQVQQVLSQGGDPESTHRALLQIDPAAAEAYRTKANQDASVVAPPVQQTPEFDLSIPESQPISVEGTDKTLPGAAASPMTAALPSQPTPYMTIGGGVQQLPTETMLQKKQREFAEYRRKQQEETDQNIRQARESQLAKGPQVGEYSPGTLVITRDASGKEVSRETVPFAPKTSTLAGAPGEYEYAVAHGYKGSFEDYQNEDANRKRPSAAPGSEPLVPTTDQFGNTVYTPRSQAAGLKVPTSSQNKPPTSAERKMLGFYERVSNSLDKIDGMETDINKMGVLDQARLKYAPNIFQTNVGQRFTQAANDFINASLRRESGAAISDGEYKRFQQIYFPMPGDSKEVLAQKKKARDVQLETFKTESGKAFAEKYGDEQKSPSGVPDIIEYERGPDGKLRVKAKK